MKNRINAAMLFLLLAILVVVPQISQHALVLGGDSLFHFNRFFDTEQQIEHRNFQYFISTYGFSQSGRIINALYGPYIAYLNGLILYIFKSWFAYQIVTDIFVLFVAGISMYYLAMSNKINHVSAVFISLLYMLTYGVTTWTTGQQFLAWGAMLIPLGLSVATRLIRDKKNPILILEMSIVTSLFIETHILSTLFLILIYIPFFIISIVVSHDKKRLFYKVGISTIITSILTSNVWFGMLQVYTSNDLLAPFYNKYPLQNGVVTLTTNGRVYYLILIIYLIQIGMILFKVCKVTMLNRIVTILGAFLFICTLPVVPWNYIFEHIRFVSIIQFPYRLLPFAEALLLLGVGLTLTNITDQKRDHNIEKLIMFVVVCLSLVFVQNKVYTQSLYWHSNSNVIASKNNVTATENGARLREYFSSSNLGAPFAHIWKPTPDYVPINKDSHMDHPYEQYNNEVAKNSSIKTTNNDGVTVSWYSKDKSYYNTGLFKYKNTRIKINGKPAVSSQYYTTDIGTIMIKSSIGKNVVNISYRISAAMKIALFISILSWIALIITLFFNIIRHRTMIKRSQLP